jgi:hypothetical protein
MMEPIIDRHVKQWTEVIGQKSGSGRCNFIKVDLSTRIPLLTLDLTLELSCGICFDIVKNGSDPFGFLDQVRFGTVIQQYLSILTEINAFRHLLARIPGFQSCLFPSRSNKFGIGRLMDVSVNPFPHRTL